MYTAHAWVYAQGGELFRRREVAAFFEATVSVDVVGVGHDLAVGERDQDAVAFWDVDHAQDVLVAWQRALTQLFVGDGTVDVDEAIVRREPHGATDAASKTDVFFANHEFLSEEG